MPGRIRWILKLENALLIAGLSALAFFGSAKFYTWSFQSYQQYSFEAQLNGNSPSIRGFMAHLLSGKETGSRIESTKTTVNGEELLRTMVFAPEAIPMNKDWSPDRLRAFKESANPSPGSVLGRLEIPSVDLSVMLLQGTDNWTLNRAVGHIEGTALPGQPGNLGIAGHRDGFFRRLHDDLLLRRRQLLPVARERALGQLEDARAKAAHDVGRGAVDEVGGHRGGASLVGVGHARRERGPCSRASPASAPPRRYSAPHSRRAARCSPARFAPAECLPSAAAGSGMTAWSR